MAMKQFQAESKRLLDLMINSIYTHREIFLREISSITALSATVTPVCPVMISRSPLSRTRRPAPLRLKITAAA